MKNSHKRKVYIVYFLYYDNYKYNNNVFETALFKTKKAATEYLIVTAFKLFITEEINNCEDYKKDEYEHYFIRNEYGEATHLKDEYKTLEVIDILKDQFCEGYDVPTTFDYFMEILYL